MTFIKYDKDKPRTDLLPPRALLEVADVSRYGADKYTVGEVPGDNNWKLCRTPGRYLAAGLRHIFLHMAGEVVDPESGKPHLSHASWDFLAELELALLNGWLEPSQGDAIVSDTA